MTLGEQIKFLKHVRCNFGNHSVSLDQEEKLYATKDGTLDTECERCHVPLLLKIDPKDNDYFFMTEIDRENLISA